MKSILKAFNPEGTLDQNLVKRLNDSIVSKTGKKGTVLQVANNASSKIFFVKKGLLRSYIIDKKGREHIFIFAPEGWVVSDLESQTYDTPTTLYIDTLEDSEIEIIDRKLLEELNLPSDLIQKQIQQLLKRVIVLQKRVIMLMSASAQERYVYFTETYPQIITRVPQKMIASYLGITPEALSKIKNEMAKGKAIS